MCTRWLLALAVVGCVGETGGFVAEDEDEAVDPADPPTDPDPPEALAAVACPKRSRTLSPKGLTFVIQISPKIEHAWEAYDQLEAVRPLIRARDLFMIERTSPVVDALRDAFPCNDIHFIAYPDELPEAYAAADQVDGIVVDWERDSFTHPQAYSIEKLEGFADKIRSKGKVAGVAPYWPQAFNDGHIIRASAMRYDLAQIQDHCSGGGPVSFGDAARALVQNFRANGLSPRNLGVEISVDSFPSADHHTDVATSAKCARKAYGKGARAIYLYGNGPPHLRGFFERMEDMGLREPR